MIGRPRGPAGGWRREAAVVAVAGTAVFAVTLVPYILAAAGAPAGKVFNGFFFIADDASTYVAKMREGADGAWGWRDPYISNPVANPVLLFFFYILWGKLTALLHLSMFVGYHLARLGGAIALVAASRSLARMCLPTTRTRRVAVVFAVGGSGLGWILSLAAALTGWHSVAGQHLDALELHLPELSGFYSIIAIPHFSLAAALMAWAVVGLVSLADAEGPGAWRRPMAMAVASMLALTLIHPQMLFVLAPLVVSYHALARRPWRRWGSCVVPFAACLPLLLYFLRVLTADPVVRAWSHQWRHQAPEMLGFVFALGLPLILALVAVASRGLSARLRLMAVWVGLVFVLLYLPNPVNIQRRLIDGIYLPVAILAAAGLEVLISRRRTRARGPLRTPGPIVVLAVGVSLVMSALVWTIGMSAALGREPIIFADRGELKAIEWLSAHRDPGLPPAVLSHPGTGLFIPERSGYRVYVGHYSETIDYLARSAMAFDAYRAGDANLIVLMRREGVEYLFFGPLEGGIGGPAPTDSRLQKVYDQDGARIYRLSG
ncbi:MAG: hypothetical protein M3010_08040 [Candidatus Dormibacteraeota bacterium]|nr:hypothetical protein [Candidatus Dormibacteraeota bacterium]